MARLSATIVSALLMTVQISAGPIVAGSVWAGPARAADLFEAVQVGRFRATCEDLGGLCFADACGRDQIEASSACRARCPSSVVMDVLPAACPILDVPAPAVLRRRG